MHSTDFQNQSPQIHILLKKCMVRRMTPIPHSWFQLCLRILLLLQDTMTKATLIRTAFNWTCLEVKKYSPLSPRWEHGSIQAATVQEELRVLHLHLKVTGKILASRQLGWRSQSLNPKRHAYSNKATPFATGQHFLIMAHLRLSISKP